MMKLSPIFLSFALLLTACGQSGPLYLPPTLPSPSTPPSSPMTVPAPVPAAASSLPLLPPSSSPLKATTTAS